MPVLDGYQASGQIRVMEASSEEGTGRRVPIVALTGHARQEDCDECLHAGMDDYLAKPFNMRQLRTVIDRWLQLPDRIITRPN
jgi:CheY-like chemotaxis protein